MNSNNVINFRGKKKGCWKEAINSRELVEKPAENKTEKEWVVEMESNRTQFLGGGKWDWSWQHDDRNEWLMS